MTARGWWWVCCAVMVVATATAAWPGQSGWLLQLALIGMGVATAAAVAVLVGAELSDRRHTRDQSQARHPSTRQPPVMGPEDRPDWPPA